MRYLLLLFMLFSAPVYAACGDDCIDKPTCEQLGYSKTITCSEGFLSCPFDSSYKWCKQYSCADGRYESADLSDSKGTTCTAVQYHGLNCYDCKCVAPASCKWNNDNKGTAFLSNQCCNGNYSRCRSACVRILIPEHAHATKTCTGCGTVVSTAYECDEGYQKSGNECISICASGKATNVEDCGISGSKGWSLAQALGDTDGCRTCIPKPCPSDYKEETCNTLFATQVCWSGDTKKCKIASSETDCCANGYTYTCKSGGCSNFLLLGDECTKCPTTPSITNCNDGCLYNCSKVGGPECSQTATWGGSVCMVCRQEEIGN